MTFCYVGFHIKAALHVFATLHILNHIKTVLVAHDIHHEKAKRDEKILPSIQMGNNGL